MSWTAVTFGVLRVGLGSLLSEMVFADAVMVVYLVFGAVVLVSGVWPTRARRGPGWEIAGERKLIGTAERGGRPGAVTAS